MSMSNNEIRNKAKDLRDNPENIAKINLSKIGREDFRAIQWIIATEQYDITDEDLDEARAINDKVRTNKI